jgi:hypothetical protein
MQKFLLFFILLVIACNNVTENKTASPAFAEDVKKQTVELEDNLGVVSMFLPVRYDTTFTWVQYSDCGRPCEKRMYRFQPKKLPVYADSRLMHRKLNDSIDQFTILHNPYIERGVTDNPDNQIFITSFHDHKKFEITHDPALREIKSDSIEKIGDRYFSVIVVDLYDSSKRQYTKKLLATTTLKSGTIDFNFELLTSQKNSLTEMFLNNSISYIETIRITGSNK